MSFDDEQRDKERLWNDLLMLTWETTDLSKVHMRPTENRTAYAFFVLMDAAFTDCEKMRGIVPIHRELVQYMAGWGRDAAESGDISGGGPVGADKDHMFSRAFDGFIKTIEYAVKHGGLRYFEDGRILIGCLTLPKWIVEKYMDEAQEEAEHLNGLWDKFDSKDGGMRYQIRTCA